MNPTFQMAVSHPTSVHSHQNSPILFRSDFTTPHTLWFTFRPQFAAAFLHLLTIPSFDIPLFRLFFLLLVRMNHVRAALDVAKCSVTHYDEGCWPWFHIDIDYCNARAFDTGQRPFFGYNGAVGNCQTVEGHY